MNYRDLIITPDVVWGFMRGFNLVPPLYRYESIEDEAAEMLAKSEVQLDLDGVVAISVQSINYLVKRQNDLCLGILEITNDQASALTGLHAKLSLNSLKEVSLSALEILCSSPRELLALDGLMTLTREQAVLLSHFQGGLSLGGILQLDDAIAIYLSQHVGSLYLANLTTLTTEEVSHLANHKGSVLLNSNLQVPREGAYLLRKHFSLQVNAYSVACLVEDCLNDGTDDALAMAYNTIKTITNTLCLEDLTVIQCSGAEILAQYPGKLQLPALQEFEPGAAALLANHNGPSLALNGLKSLSTQVAEALGEHHGELLLGGLVSFDENSAELLALHNGPLALPLPHGGNTKFGWFKTEDHYTLWSGYQGTKVLWKPSGIDFHDLAVFENILQTHPAGIEIPEEVHYVSNTVLARLGYACRTMGISVVIPGLSEIDHRQCQLLTGSHLKQRHRLGTVTLALDGLLQMNDQVAQELGTSGFSLSLSGLSSISSKDIQCLTQDIKHLALCGLESIDEEECKHLANLRGQLRLEGIKILTAPSAKAISNHPGRLTLNGIHSISEEAIIELSRHVDPVELKGIRWTMMNTTLLETYISKAIILDQLEVYFLIRAFQHFACWKRLSDEANRNLRSISNDSSTPELIVRLLVELIIGYDYASCHQFWYWPEWHVIKADFVDFKRRKADPSTVRECDQTTYSDWLSANHLCHRKTPIASHPATDPRAGNQAVALRIFAALRPILT